MSYMSHPNPSGGESFSLTGVHFNQSSVTLVSNVIHQAHIDGDDEHIRSLLQKVASGAYYNAGQRHDAPKCHPNTREAVIGDIISSISSMLDPRSLERLIWLYGPAGSGKSSIALRIAEICDSRNILAADFFFSRMVPDRRTSDSLVPTLAYKLTSYNRRIKKYVAEAISLDNLILTRPLQHQFEELILRPIARAREQEEVENEGEYRHQSYPSVIIIDGLDECCPDISQRDIVSSLNSALDNIPVPVIFFIASRPDPMIRDTINEDILSSRTRRIVLDNRYQPNRDIEIFLRAKFEEIKRSHPLATTLPSDWPTNSDINFLVRKASGQFIYASTAMKFVESPGHRPTERLDIILNLTPAEHNLNPFAELDEVYTNILSSIDQAKLQRASTVFAFLFAASQLDFSSSTNAPRPATAAFLEEFLGYAADELILVFNDLHSLVEVPARSFADLAEIRLHHASLSNFLQDRGRAGPLFIDMGKYCVQFARICIRHLTPWLYSQGLNNFNQPSAVIHYSFRFFLQLFSIASSDDDLLRDLTQFPVDLFIKHIFNGWISAVSLIPHLFEWTKAQNLELYNIYNDHYTTYIKTRLLTEPVSFQPQWSYIFTAVTLNITTTSDFSTICKLFVHGSNCPDPEQVKLVQKHLFGEMNVNFSLESLNLADYLTRLRALLLDPSNSGRHHVGNSRYSELAWELFDMFTGTNSVVILDSLANEQNLIINLFLASLDRAQGNTLAHHLRSSGHRQFKSFAQNHEMVLRMRIAGYIQRYGGEEIPTREPMAPSRSDSITSFVSVHDAASEHAFSIIDVDSVEGETSSNQPLSDQGMPIPNVSVTRLRNRAREFMRKVLH